MHVYTLLLLSAVTAVAGENLPMSNETRDYMTKFVDEYIQKYGLDWSQEDRTTIRKIVAEKAKNAGGDGDAAKDFTDYVTRMKKCKIRHESEASKKDCMKNVLLEQDGTMRPTGFSGDWESQRQKILALPPWLKVFIIFVVIMLLSLLSKFLWCLSGMCFGDGYYDYILRRQRKEDATQHVIYV